MTRALPRVDAIDALGIDGAGSLWVKPATVDFSHIYRAAMEVRWDPVRRCLFSPKPREWSYARWFRQIRDAAADEYGVALKLTPTTTWSGIDDELRRAIANVDAGSTPDVLG